MSREIAKIGRFDPVCARPRCTVAPIVHALERPVSYWAFLTIENRKVRDAQGQRDGFAPFPPPPATPARAELTGPGPARVEDAGRPAPVWSAGRRAYGAPRLGDVSPSPPPPPGVRARHVMQFRVHTNQGRLIDIMA